MGFLWKPPSAHTIQAERPIKKLEAGHVKCRAHEGGNQKGLLSDSSIIFMGIGGAYVS